MSWAEDNGFDAYDYDDFSSDYSEASDVGYPNPKLFLPSVRNSSKQDLSSVVYDLVKRVRALENEIDLIKLKEETNER